MTFTITTAQALGIVLIGVPAYSSVDQTGTATNTTGNPSVPTSGATATAAEMALSVIVTSGTGGVMTWTSPWAALEAGQHGVGPWMNVGWTALAATGVATAAGTAVSSNWGGNIITVVQVSGTDTSPAYAATAAALGGGTGSWAGAANAQGTGDVTYATWTAP